MRQAKMLCLSDLVEMLSLDCIFGASVAYLSPSNMTSGSADTLSAMGNFYTFIIAHDGRIDFMIEGKRKSITHGELMVIAPYKQVEIDSHNSLDFDCLLIDSDYYDEIQDSSENYPRAHDYDRGVLSYHLDDVKCDDLGSIMHQLRRTIQQPHVYKREMVKSLAHVFLLFINGLSYEDYQDSFDFHNKENIFSIFIHLASVHYKQERQLKYYADMMNVTTTYLSRAIKEFSGSSVHEHLTCMVYNEACKLLKSSDMTIGEISYELGFRDQSAFSAYFKSRSGKTPVAYRGR